MEELLYCLLILASVRPEVTHMRRLVPSLHSQTQGFVTPGRNHLAFQVSVQNKMKIYSSRYFQPYL